MNREYHRMSIRETIRQGLEKMFHSGLWNKMTDDSEYQQELASIKYGEKSLLTAGGDNQPMYQIIDLGDRFLFADMDDWQLITDFDTIPESVFKGKKNLVIQKKDISSIDIGVAYDGEDKDGKLLEYAEDWGLCKGRFQRACTCSLWNSRKPFPFWRRFPW